MVVGRVGEMQEVALGPHRFDVTHRALVMGILNRTPDSFYDQGEFWDLDALAADCAADGVYEFFLTATPLNLEGGVGSPANAVAVK